MPLNPITFQNLQDIENFARRLAQFSFADNSMYHQLVVDTQGNTYYLEDILKLSSAEVEGLSDIKFWCRTEKTNQENTAPEIITLRELKVLQPPGLTYNKSLVDTLHPYLIKVQAQYWLEILKNFHGENIAESVCSKDFSKQWIKSIDGRLFYLPRLQKTIESISDIFDKVSFNVNCKDPLSSAVVTSKELNLKELKYYLGGWDYLEFEYDESLRDPINDQYIHQSFAEKLNKYNVDIDDSNLYRHLLKDSQGKTHVLEELIDKSTLKDAEKPVIFTLDFIARKWESVKTLFKPSKGFYQTIKSVGGKNFTRAHLDQYPKTKVKYTPEDTRWSPEEIRTIVSSKNLLDFHFKNYDKKLADKLQFSLVEGVQIHYLPNDKSNKEYIIWPAIAYNGQIYDKYALKLSLRNISVIPGTTEYLTPKETADNWALQSLLKIAYAGDLNFAANLNINQQKLQAGLTATLNNLKNAKDYAKDSIEHNEKLLETHRQNLKKHDLSIPELLKLNSRDKKNKNFSNVFVAGIALMMVGLILTFISNPIVLLIGAGVCGLGVLIMFGAMCCRGAAASRDFNIIPSDVELLEKHETLLEWSKDIAQDEAYLQQIKIEIFFQEDKVNDSQVQNDHKDAPYKPVTSASTYALTGVDPSIKPSVQPTPPPVSHAPALAL